MRFVSLIFIQLKFASRHTCILFECWICEGFGKPREFSRGREGVEARSYGSEYKNEKCLEIKFLSSYKYYNCHLH
jgi:hypothetical protein